MLQQCICGVASSSYNTRAHNFLMVLCYQAHCAVIQENHTHTHTQKYTLIATEKVCISASNMCKLVFLALSVIFLSNKKGQANYFMSVMIMVPSCLFVGVCVVLLFFVCVFCFCCCFGGGQHLWSWLFCLMTTLPEYQFHWPLSVPWGPFLAASYRRCWKCPPRPSPSSVASSGPAQ